MEAIADAIKWLAVVISIIGLSIDIALISISVALRK
jgi:hypothetical protein